MSEPTAHQADAQDAATPITQADYDAQSFELTDLSDALELVKTVDLIRMSTDIAVRAVLSKDAAEVDDCNNFYRQLERYLDWRLQPAFAAWMASGDVCALSVREIIDNDTSSGQVAHRAARLAYQSGRIDGLKLARESLFPAPAGTVTQ